MFELIILPVGASYGYLDFYQEQMPDYFVACSCYDGLEESQAVYQVLIAHGWNVLYVVDDHEMLPDFYRQDGNSYYIGGVAWHYVGILEHEIDHLRCECNFRN
jgi:hypothetical protein